MAKSKQGGSGNKSIMIYVAAIGALLMLVVYFLVYRKLVDEADKINTSNKALEQRVHELEGYYLARETNLANTLLLEQLADELLTVYPADAREEDAIILAVRMQSDSGASFQSINMEKGNSIHVVSSETVAAAQSEKYNQEIRFNSMNTTYANEVSYEGLKQMVQTVYNSNNRIGIQNIAYSKGDVENPNLSGHMDLVFYSVNGTGKEYVVPDIVPYIAGTDNIFGDIETPPENANN